MVSVDNRMETCKQRLRETDHHIDTGHFRSAVESASGGVEFMLQVLFDELLNNLNANDFRLKLALEASHKQKINANSPHGSLTFAEWIKFYRNEDLFDELTAAYQCQFCVFSAETLHTLRILRNKCVHENYRPSQDEALWVRNTLAIFLRESSNVLGDGEKSMTTMHDFSQEWQDTWTLLIEQWIENNPDSPEAELLSTLLDQLMLIVGIISDSRVSFALKLPLIWSVYYVIDPNDLIPEGRDSVEALIDDAAVLAFTLHWYLQQADELHEVLPDHWPAETDPVEFVENMHTFILDSHQDMFSDEVWHVIRGVAEAGPQTVWKHRHPSELPSNKDVDEAYRFITEEPNQDTWYEVWRVRVQDWVFENLNSELGETVFLVPDLFMLIVRLIGDNRVPATVKARLAAASAYVVSPFDLIPESLLGVVGLTDDAGALALVGYWLVHVVNIDRNILREHWPGAGDPVTTIEELHSRIQSNAESIFAGKTGVWSNILQRFGYNSNDSKAGLLERIRFRFKMGIK